MKKASLLPLFSLCTVALALTSCQTGLVNNNDNQQADNTDAVSETYLPTTIQESPYGYVVPSVASALPDSEITYTVYSYDDLYAPAKLVVNGETLDLDENNQVTTTMAEEGNTVQPLFAADLSDFYVIADYYSMKVKAIDGCLYKIEEGDWQTTPTFSGEWQESPNFSETLIPNRTYVVSIYMPGDGDTLLDSEVFSKTILASPVNDTALDNIVDNDLALKGTYTINADYYGSNYGSGSGELEVAITSNRYTMNLTSGGETDSLTYYKGSADTIVLYMVDRQNTLSEQYVGDGFSSSFYNPFTQVLSTYFSVSSDYRYLTLDFDRVTSPTIFTSMILGDSGITPSELVVEVDNDYNPVSLHLEGYYYATSTVGLKYTITYDADFVSADEVEGDVESPYETEPEHEALQELFDGLAEGNYVSKITVKPANGTAEETTLIVTPDTALEILSDGTETGMLQNENGFYRFTVNKTDQTLEYSSGYPLQNVTLSLYSPTFDFAPEVFEVTGTNSYHLRNSSLFYNYADYTLPDVLAQNTSQALYIDDDSLDIVLTDEGAVFTYTYTDSSSGTYGTVTVDVSVGTAEFPYSDYALTEV